MDKVFIEGLEIEALIGIYDWERRIRQPLRFDIEMAFDNRVPAASDRIGDTLDYKAVSKRLVAFVSQSGFGLVETLAERCAALILDEFKVDKVKLKLSKPGAVRGAQAVGVIIKRKREDTPQLPATTATAGAKTGATAAPRPAASMPAAQAAIAAPPTARQFVPVWTTIAAKPPGPPPKAPSTASTRLSPMPASAAMPDTTARSPSTSSLAPSSASAAVSAATPGPAPAPSAPPATNPAAPAGTSTPARVVTAKRLPSRFHSTTRQAYLSLGSNIAPEVNLTRAVAALRARFGEVVVSPVYRTPAVGFRGPDFLNAIAVIDSDIHPFALNDWLHALELKQGRDRRDASYSDRTLDIDIIYFGDLVLDGPGDFQLPRPELHHAFVLKPLADIAPEFIDPVRRVPLAKLWAAHPEHARPPQQVPLEL